MAHLHIAQIAYLSQELTEHLMQANNLLMRSRYELDCIHQISKRLSHVHDELERDLELEQMFR